MTTLNYSHTLVAGANENVNDVQDMFNDARTVINGNLDDVNLGSATKDKLGLSDATTVRRGKSIIATSEGRTNTAYGLLTTADRVSSLVLPTDGLIVVSYQATWQESVNATAQAAIFIGANQLKIATGNNASPLVQETLGVAGGAGIDSILCTGPRGLYSPLGTDATAYTNDVTTGQVVGDGNNTTSGGPCYIFAAAGTYDVSVQFKAASGTVTVKNRKLWVWTIGF